MTIQAAFSKTLQELEGLYEEREAYSMARILFEDAFSIRNFNRLDVFEHTSELEEYLKKLKQQIPLQYVLGLADFYGLKFKVNESVLIPRQETEELVYWILESHKGAYSLNVLDIGTGSGCIPITLKKQRAAWNVHGVDVSPGALQVARENALLNKVDVHFEEQDILETAALENKWDIIISNPPYIPRSESVLMPENVLKYEPALALFVESNDPLLFYRKISDLSYQSIQAGGRLYFELNEFNASAVGNLLEEKGFREVFLKKDIHDKYRMITALK
jgi:release factor glutamine methyltransferase